ncbi:MAG: fumarylacetoacetate hydrolase family protein [Rhodobacteraceae bacterium]|nr:fumarylacetoacetate hydrolase family protein [Paracoccaceae bacterium]
MKLASLKDGSRDGRLVVVSRDLERCVSADHVAGTMQAVLDDWPNAAPALEALARDLEGNADADRFDQAKAASPLPRAYQWADGSAYVNHVELVRKARGVEMPESFYRDPLMYQGGSDTFLGPRDDIPAESEEFGIDLEAEVAVVVDDTPLGIKAGNAGSHIKLIMLVNDVTLRSITAPELAKGFGFFQSKPSSAFSPVAVTPDELGEAWDGARLHLPMCVDINGEPFGRAEAGVDMVFDFPQLIAHAARTRHLSAGAIVGSGTISNRLDGGPGRPVGEGGVGYSCLAEVRTVETIRNGVPSTPFLRFGDTVKIWMNDKRGNSIFGEIEQTVRQIGV